MGACEGPCLPHCAAKSDTNVSHLLAGLFIGATLALMLAMLLLTATTRNGDLH